MMIELMTEGRPAVLHEIHARTQDLAEWRIASLVAEFPPETCGTAVRAPELVEGEWVAFVSHVQGEG
jgi:hypothetical protein